MPTTTPTRRQMMVAALAAGGAAAVPAGAAAGQTKPQNDLAYLDALVDGLPEQFRVMVYLNRIKTFPMADRQRLVGQFRSNPGLAHIADEMAEYLGVPA
jgi:hypothetical protein